MKIAVTGGAGFIGSHLVDRLIDQGHDVVVIDNLSGGSKDFLSGHFSLRKMGRFRFCQVDLRDTQKLVRALDPEIDLIYHLAANADISLGVENPSLDFNHSILATFSLLQAMRHHRIKKMVYTSGSGVYGDRGAHYSSETFGPLQPVSMYGAGKLGAEGLISAFSHLYEMNAWILRPANIIGPRSTHGVVFDFIKRLKKDPTELRILGNGMQSKAYLYIDDVIDALFLIQKKSKDRVNFFNISSSSFINVNQIAKIVIQQMKLGQVRFRRGKEKTGWKGDVAIVRISNLKIEKLGWRSHYTSRQAVQATVQALLQDPRLN